MQHTKSVDAAEDVINVSACELESIINQLMNPNPEYQMHASALRNQLKNLLSNRQLAVGEEQYLDESHYPLDKRSVAALAAQGLLRGNSYKRGLATLAKNGQLPTQDALDNLDKMSRGGNKRYGAREAQEIYGKRNIGTLARDFQLPNGKRNVATMARLASQPKRNLAAIARYNSMHMSGAGSSNGNDLESIDGTPSLNVDEESPEKRNIGALKSSPVHGMQQKRQQSEEVYLPVSAVGDMDYAELSSPNSYWWYPNYAGYADVDWGFRRAQKRFLDTTKDAELFGIENGPMEQFAALARAYPAYGNMNMNEDEFWEENPNEIETQSETDMEQDLTAVPQKRHIGAVLRSGFMPSYHSLRNNMGGMGGVGRFSRSGRARQFV